MFFWIIVFNTLFFLGLFGVIYLIKYVEAKRFDSSIYKSETNVALSRIKKDVGLYGEYLTSLELEKVPDYSKILINAYIPKGKNQTTECDLIFIHETGIYVLESKNYSGWIFGKDEDFKWTQTFPNGKKQPFYNPLKQNETHVKALHELLNEYPRKVFKSVIVFSNRCKLKKLSVVNEDIVICRREELVSRLKQYIKNQPKIFNQNEMDSIYLKVKPYCNVIDEIKEQHIQNIKNQIS